MPNDLFDPSDISSSLHKSVESFKFVSRLCSQARFAQEEAQRAKEEHEKKLQELRVTQELSCAVK